jgi:hypothetical protein
MCRSSSWTDSETLGANGLATAGTIFNGGLGTTTAT